MKKLVLIRHAEAEPTKNIITDFDRPLTATGKQDAAKAGAKLAKLKVLPEVIISSPALRALTTANIFATALGLIKVEVEAKIYEATDEDLLQIIHQLNEQYKVVVVVGHNPGISNLLYYLTGKITTMPTCAWAVVELKVDSWVEVSSNTGNVV